MLIHVAPVGERGRGDPAALEHDARQHHRILFYQLQRQVADGTLADCDDLERQISPQNLPFPLYLSQESEDRLELPEGVAMPLRGRQPLAFQMHHLNAGSAPIDAHVDLTVEYTTRADFERAGPFASFHAKIAVPAHGTQSVDGHCAVPSGSRFFSMTTHSHKYTTSAAVRRWRSGQMGAQLVDTRDWEHPAVARWAQPFLALSDDEEVYCTCTYRNDGDRPIEVGESANKNEMCMAAGYYFPASRATV